MSKYYVYRFKDAYGKVLYVGRTSNLDARIVGHFSKQNLDNQMYKMTDVIEFIEMESDADMYILEVYFINKYKPVFNKESKGVDNFTYDIKIDNTWEIYQTLDEKNKLFIKLQSTNRINELKEKEGFKMEEESLKRFGEAYVYLMKHTQVKPRSRIPKMWAYEKYLEYCGKENVKDIPSRGHFDKCVDYMYPGQNKGEYRVDHDGKRCRAYEGFELI